MGCENTPSAASSTASLPQPRSNFVKHPLQNTENDFYQLLSDSFRVHQFRFRPGLRPGPRWFTGALLLRGGKDKGREGKVRAGEGEGEHGEDGRGGQGLP